MNELLGSVGEFSVYQFFASPEGDHEEVLRFVDAVSAMQMAGQLSRSVGGRIGTTARIIITDGDDFTCFEWLHGKGVVFPPQEPATAPQESPG